jgi:hypothetical protein
LLELPQSFLDYEGLFGAQDNSGTLN